MISIPTLETPRLLMRQFRQSDFDALAALSADPEVMKFLGDGRPKARAETWLAMASYLGHWELRGYGLWAVEEKKSRKLVGMISIGDILKSRLAERDQEAAVLRDIARVSLMAAA